MYVILKIYVYRLIYMYNYVHMCKIFKVKLLKSMVSGLSGLVGGIAVDSFGA